MKLLIVEDDEPLAEVTANLLRALDRRKQCLESITLAGDLETALEHLPEQDAVLCDGRFPLSQGSPLLVEEWDVVQREARRRGIYFLLYSGCVRALASACATRTPALQKPARIEEIYAALTTPADRGIGRARQGVIAPRVHPAGGEQAVPNSP